MALTLSTAAKSALSKIVQDLDADVLLFNAPIERHRDRRIIRTCHKRKCRPNLILLLVTEGGDPDAAYRIARCLQNRYQKFSCFVSGFCKSAGTLLLLGANELIFSEHGEIGPLDIQLAKRDELWESESGLTVMTALTALHENAQEAFDHFFLSVTTRSRGRITVRTASDIAAKLTQALFSPISDQLDPIHLGEVYRSMTIAREYGTRLMRKSHNFDVNALNSLLSDYPSHGFVIDKEEASEMFRNVRACTGDEQSLMNELGDVAHIPSDQAIVKYISDEVTGEVNAFAPTEQTNTEQAGNVGTPAQAPSTVPTNGEAHAETLPR